MAKASEGFKGYALAWYRVKYGYNINTLWKDFISALEQAFEPAGQTAILWQQLDCLTCKGHTFLDYVTEFHRLSEKVSDTEKAQIYKFICGLSMNTANKVVQQVSATLEAAIKIATLYKARKESLNKIFFQLPDQDNRAANPDPNGLASMELDQLYQRNPY